MYSAVLMLALTAGSETADFGRNRCSCAASCSTSVSCSSSCHGRTGLFNRGHGCSSSCSTAVHCSASSGCSSRCHGGGLFSRRNGCHSSCSSGCSYSAPVCCGGGAPVIMEKKALPGGEKKGEELKKPKGTTQLSAPATIVVSVPAGARLIVDGSPTNSTSELRTLVTPNLEFGATYVYTMQAEIVREGRTLVQTQDVNVRGGETTNVQFQFSNQAVATR